MRLLIIMINRGIEPTVLAITKLRNKTSRYQYYLLFFGVTFSK
jgi:hypothetical protein